MVRLLLRFGGLAPPTFCQFAWRTRSTRSVPFMPVLSITVIGAGEDPRNRRNSWILRCVRRKGHGRPSSCRNRLGSNSRPRLALHELLLLDVGPDGTITVTDVILIRPRR